MAQSGIVMAKRLASLEPAESFDWATIEQAGRLASLEPAESFDMAIVRLAGRLACKLDAASDAFDPLEYWASPPNAASI